MSKANCKESRAGTRILHFQSRACSVVEDTENKAQKGELRPEHRKKETWKLLSVSPSPLLSIAPRAAMVSVSRIL